MTGPRSARMVLRDPTVDAAVLETPGAAFCAKGWATTRLMSGRY
jgi:hypothetical protein